MKNQIVIIILSFAVIITACKPFSKNDSQKPVTKLELADTTELSDLLKKNKGLLEKLKTVEVDKATYKKMGSDFLIENSKRKGVVSVTPEMQYEIVVAGEGNKVSIDDYVDVYFKVRMIDGSLLDDSFKNDSPYHLRLRNMISGWQQALPLMKVGTSFRLFLAPDLAYGDNSDGIIPAESTLIFDIQILGSSKK